MTTQRDISARLDRAAERARAADRVIARIDERENSQVSCGHGVRRDSATNSKLSAAETPAGINLAPTEAERAVDKHWPKYFAEWAKLQQAANGIAVKESK